RTGQRLKGIVSLRSSGRGSGGPAGSTRPQLLSRPMRPGFAMRMEAVILPEFGSPPDEPILVSFWFARRGDEVWEGDRLVEVIVGPATFDVPAPRSGRLAEIREREDDLVRPGAILGLVAVDEVEESADIEGNPRPTGGHDPDSAPDGRRT